MKRTWNRRRILVDVVLLAVLVFMLFRWLETFEHNQVYHPSRELDATGAELGRPFEDVWLRAEDGTDLNAWFYPAQTNSPRANMAVLVCHGNGGNISHRLDLYEALLESGVSVFALDYRGYGRSAGKPTEHGTYLDAKAAYDWLVERGFPGENIVVYGESLGGGIASELASSRTVGGLILQSTFSCTADIGAELFPWLPVRWINRIKYNTCGKLPKLSIPILVLHSRSDALIGFHHAEKNFAAAGEPKILWEIEGDHNDPLANRSRFVDGLEAFLRLIEKVRAEKLKSAPAGT
jgi:uncharacterized protein